MNINALHEQFSHYGKNAKEWLRKCALLLPEIEKYQVWKEKGFNSIYEYTFKLASMSKFQVDDALRVLRNINDKPELLKIAKQKGVNAVRAVSSIATKETAPYWAKQAKRMSKNELEMFVRETRMAEEKTKTGSANPLQTELLSHSTNGVFLSFEQTTTEQKNFESLSMNLKPQIAARLKRMYNGDWNELMEKFIKLYEEELERNKPEAKNKASRTIPNRIKKYILKRSNGKCEFPNCHKKYDHLHHTDRFAAKQTHDPDKIFALCKAHHDLAHRGLIDDEGQAPTTWKIRRGTDYSSENFYTDSRVQFHRRV